MSKPQLHLFFVKNEMLQFQIWLSPTLTPIKIRIRSNPVYTFVLASRKRVNPDVEMHLALEFIYQWTSPSTSKVGQLLTYAMLLILWPLVNSKLSSLSRDVTLKLPIRSANLPDAYLFVSRAQVKWDRERELITERPARTRDSGG